MTCQLSNTLKNHGVKKGDRVCLYLPNSPLAVVTMLACSRIGAAHRYVCKVYIGMSVRFTQDTKNSFIHPI